MSVVDQTECTTPSQSPVAKKRKISDLVSDKMSQNSNNCDQNSNNMEVCGSEASGGISNNRNSSGNGSSNSNAAVPQEIDEGLYSRQLYVLGHEAMRKMARSDVLISGMNGLGAEIAKNVILAGVKSVTLQDTRICNLSDLGNQFYLSSDDIGKNRAEASHSKFSELNTYVPVHVYTKPLNEQFLRDFQVVVIADHMSFEDKQKWGEFAHSNQIAFIVASSNGLFGQVFCDFGENFIVHDTTGETALSTMVASVTCDNDGIVTCLEETRHGMEDGDYVTFSEVEGMSELNNCEPRKIQIIGPYSFKIGDTSQFSEYKKGGIVTQVKMPKKFDFKSFKDNFFNPDILQVDFSKLDYPLNLHLAYYTLDQFVLQEKRFPRCGRSEDTRKFLALANESKNLFKIEEINEKLLSIFANIVSGEIGPVDAILGGIVAQEVMKACSGKFGPIMQWFYYDAIECLSPDHEFETIGENSSRYQGQMIVFGEQFQKRLEILKYFVVGAGAIGCELLKNFAMMGIGKVIVTDMDLIEKSNLNRQFLFRPHNVQCSKSVVAAEVVSKMNPSINIVAHENRVGPESEQIYNDAFFANLDGVANALDNIEARTYMDRRCVYYRLPLLESGTLGTKGNTQVVVPYLTESYSSSQDPPEKSIPICTLKNFPNAIEHTLQWARDVFEGIFNHSAGNAIQYLSDSKFMERTLKLQGAQPLEILESLKSALVTEKPSDFFDCVKWARNHFEEQYVNQIKQLLFNFPADQLTSSGQAFWSGPKRCPRPLVFDLEDSLHIDYIYAAANLKAEMYGIEQNRNRDQIIEMVKKVQVPVFVPKSGVRIAETDAQLQSNNGVTLSQDRIVEIQKELPPQAEAAKTIRIFAIEFEKDDDHNLHMDFIVAASNLRATNYRISLADRHKSKLIAGKIIPAIATTTSVVAGLAVLEIFKLHTGQTYREMKIDRFRNSFVNLALPYFGFSEPMPAPKMKYYDTEWTLWDRFDVQGEMTLREFINYFQTEHKLKITMLSQGVCMLYSFFIAKAKIQERMDLVMSEIVKRVSKKTIEPHVNALVFEIVCDDEEGNDVEIPYVRYILPK